MFLLEVSAQARETPGSRGPGKGAGGRGRVTGPASPGARGQGPGKEVPRGARGMPRGTCPPTRYDREDAGQGSCGALAAAHLPAETGGPALKHDACAASVSHTHAPALVVGLDTVGVEVHLAAVHLPRACTRGGSYERFAPSPFSPLHPHTHPPPHPTPPHWGEGGTEWGGGWPPPRSRPPTTSKACNEPILTA